MARLSLIRAKTLAHLLGVTQGTLRRWSAYGLVGYLLNDEQHFDNTSVNTFLAICQHNFPFAPTLHDLWSGTLVLINHEGAMECLHTRTIDTLLTRYHAGRILGIKLCGVWRFCKASVEACRWEEVYDDHLSRVMTGHVLGVSKRSVETDLVRQKRLEFAPLMSTPHNGCPVTRQSLLKLLGELLPSWIDPQDWLEDRLESNLPLVRFRAALQQLGTNAKGLHTLLRGQHLQYIQAPGGQIIFIEPDSIAAYMEHIQPLTHEEIGRLFDTRPNTVGHWIHKGLLTCPIQEHSHTEKPLKFYPACLKAVLRALLSPGMKALQWYHTRMYYGGALIDGNDAARQLDVPFAHLCTLAQTGEIRGVMTPGGTWRFTHHRLADVQRRQRRVG